MPANYSTNIVYLSEAQYQELLTNQTITVNGTTVTYNENDIYVTPQAEPITDVRINGTSIGSNGVANIPVASSSTLGVIKPNLSGGLEMVGQGLLQIYGAPLNDIKLGIQGNKAIVPSHQHESIYYGLTKLAGIDLANETVTLGIYPDTSKAAIQNMLGITDLLSTEETTTATAAHALNSTFMMNGKLHRATAAIAIGDAVEVGTNCEVVKADEVFVKRTDYATTSRAGVGRVSTSYGTSITNDGTFAVVTPSEATIKQGGNQYQVITPYNQHTAIYYGLSKLAGVNLASETVTLGTYPETSKTAIRNMIGAASPNVIAVQDEQPINADTKVWLPETQAAGVEVPTYAEFQALDASTVKDVQINNTSIINNGIANIPICSSSTFGVIKVDANSFGIKINNEGRLYTDTPSLAEIKAGTQAYKPIVPANVHYAAFYGLAKAAGYDEKNSEELVGTYSTSASAAIRSMIGAGEPLDVQINGTSIVSNGVANIPMAGNNQLGVVWVSGDGLAIRSTGQIYAVPASDAFIKSGSANYNQIVPAKQHLSTFYGLATAAGDTTQSASSNAVGTYTAEAKAAIQSMLGIDLSSIAQQVEIPLVETVSGTTPSITGQPNTRYVCGEVSTISITPPSAGSVDVIFESGSTAAVLTVPNTVKWPAWFDATTLETDTTYEILITDGVYGSVMTWAN